MSFFFEDELRSSSQNLDAQRPLRQLPLIWTSNPSFFGEKTLAQGRKM